jgi:hypothetical protein
MENEELILNEDIEPTPEPEPFVIPLVYNYKADTKEFTGVVEQADKDNAKSAKVGHFVPMVHANATLLEPPAVEENQIQVYSKTVEPHQEPYEVIDPETGEKHTEYRTVEEVIENWNIEADYRKNFLKVDNDLNVTDITTIGEQEGYIIIDKITGEDIKVNKDWYKIVDNEVVKKSEEEYEQEQADIREADFKSKFFNIEGFGWYRKQPKGYQSAVESMNVLFNIANVSDGIQAGLIIFYQEPDFTKEEECTEEWLIEHQIIQPAMAKAEFMQLYVAFMTAWNNQEHINED